jgi:hypothetical protein
MLVFVSVDRAPQKKLTKIVLVVREVTVFLATTRIPIGTTKG